MGLLTSARTNGGRGPTWAPKLAKHRTALSCASFLLGVAFLFAMPHAEFSHKTYFSENALLPGLVQSEFDEEAAARSFLADLRDEAKKRPGSAPFAWIEARFRQMGLEVYNHNFTLNFPLGEAGQEYTGNNVYAILRAPRSSSTESIVLSTPYRPPLSVEAPTDVSLATMLAAAKFFRRQNYWAKDVIFLVTQHEQLGMQAWLEAYHKTSCGYGRDALLHGDLEARAGSIQAAVNLEVSTEKFTHLNVKVEGLNGQLPNLDLVNLVNRLCVREGMHKMFHGVEDHQRPDSWPGYWRSLGTLASMGLRQAAGGVPSGNHGLFHRFGVEAVTVESVRRPARRREFDVGTLGVVVEGTFRSLNNLLERFHQSFFFYLLPSTGRYVSIGMYMPGFGLLAGSLVIQAVGLWAACTENASKSGDKKEGERASTPMASYPDVAAMLPGWAICHALGMLLAFAPRPASWGGAKLFGLRADESVNVGLLAGSIAGAVIVARAARSPAASFGSDWRLVKCVASLELAVLAFSTALCNFGLACFMALAFVPAAMLASPSGRAVVALSKRAALVAIHPLSLVFAACAVDTWRTFPEKGLPALASASAQATKTAVMFSVTDGYIYGNYAFVVATCCLMPSWHLLWYLACLDERARRTSL